jgi:hypothetical protein
VQITLAGSPDPDVHQQASAALRGLAVTDSNKMKIVQEGHTQYIYFLKVNIFTCNLYISVFFFRSFNTVNALDYF